MSISNDQLEMEIWFGDNHKSVCIRYMKRCVQFNSCKVVDATLWCYMWQIQRLLN
jgi:hypothetical protein